MRKMKDSGIEWIGEIPENWEVARVKNLYEFQTGWTPSTGNASYFDGDIPWANISDIGADRVIYDTAKHITQEAVNVSSMNITPEGSLMYSFKLSVGNVSFCGRDMYTNEAIASFLPNENNDLRYLYYAAPIFIIKNANENIYGAKLLNQDLIKNALMLKLPLEEQVRIADYLDKKCAKIDAIIAAKEKTNELLKERRQSIIYEAVTKGLDPTVPMKDSGVEWIGMIPESWATIRVKHLATEKDSLFLDGDWINSDVITDEGIRYLTSGNVGEGFYKEQGKGYISEETFKKLNCLAAFPGDLMISRLNEPVGRCCIIPDGEDYYVVAVDNVILRPNRNFCKKYLLYCMNTNGYANAALMAASGTTMQRISRTALGNLTIPVATYAEQTAIVDYLDERCYGIDAIISANNISIDKLKEYRQSVIYEAVTGKVEI
jgi:type I restriction enzyme S subunit